MTASLRALLTGILDYEGLFPPAKLLLNEALRNYLRYRTEPEAWMLGRFICPAARLAELARLLPAEPPSSPWGVSVLASGGNDSAEFLANLRSDLDQVSAFRRQHPAIRVDDVFEARLLPDA